jgi:hypothetical protein
LHASRRCKPGLFALKQFDQLLSVFDEFMAILFYG